MWCAMIPFLYMVMKVDVDWSSIIGCILKLKLSHHVSSILCNSSYTCLINRHSTVHLQPTKLQKKECSSGKHARVRRKFLPLGLYYSKSKTRYSKSSQAKPGQVKITSRKFYPTKRCSFKYSGLTFFGFIICSFKISLMVIVFLPTVVATIQNNFSQAPNLSNAIGIAVAGAALGGGANIMDTMRSSMLVDTDELQKIYNSMMKKRTDLLYVNNVDDGQKSIVLKVCCCCNCNRIITFGKEKWLPYTCFEDPDVQKYLQMSDSEWEKLGVSQEVRHKIKRQYTQQCFQSQTGLWNTEKMLLNKFMLSPHTYHKTTIKKKHVPGKMIQTKEYSFGSCIECYKHLYTKKVYRKTNPVFKKPENAISNKKCFGYTPKVLTNLNKTELELISKCRVDRHLINLTGGSHKCIVG